MLRWRASIPGRLHAMSGLTSTPGQGVNLLTDRLTTAPRSACRMESDLGCAEDRGPPRHAPCSRYAARAPHAGSTCRSSAALMISLCSELQAPARDRAAQHGAVAIALRLVVERGREAQRKPARGAAGDQRHVELPVGARSHPVIAFRRRLDHRRLDPLGLWQAATTRPSQSSVPCAMDCRSASTSMTLRAVVMSLISSRLIGD